MICYRMVRQTFDIQNKWRVIVYWNIDYDFFDVIAQELYSFEASENTIKEIFDTMTIEGKAFTYSSNHTSIVGFNKHSNETDYLNSIVHEAEHIKQDILKEYDIEDKDETPAYLIGYIVMEMYKEFRRMYTPLF